MNLFHSIRLRSRIRRSLVCAAFWTFCVMTLQTSQGQNQLPQISAADQATAMQATSTALAAGEFAVAKSFAARSLVTSDRQQILAQVATSQSLSGDQLGAATTLREIDSPSGRQSVIDQTRGAAKGGGAFADFDSLMNLIETTVVPDTWEALGGNSTMAPYPQGVYVDVAGTVQLSPARKANDVNANQSLADIRSLLADPSAASTGDWRAPSALRCISLRRLRDEITTRRMTGQPLGDRLLNLAGLSKIQYLVFTDNDIVIAAPVGGIDNDRGWFIDRQSGRSTLRSDFLARCLKASFAGTAFGCTIDPTPQGMQTAMQVATQIRANEIPIGQSAEKLRDALGMQRVEVFGAAGDTAAALLMVEADRHMKQLALGEEPMPEGVANYLDAVDHFIAQGPPDGMLLRLWFTANPQSVRSDNDQQVFEIDGDAIRLSGENQRALSDGGRGRLAVDPRSQFFVDQFNQNWNRIRDHYPIYGSLESLYRVAAVAELVQRFGDVETHHQLAMGLASEDESRDWPIAVPKQVQSIATLHTVRSGKQRHHVLLASGGVSVTPSTTVPSKLKTYASLTDQRSIANQAPTPINQWWWDIR
ncbi:DUF1598 domain-containing protein [Stieleria sp. TO1_6]|uniref:DUF1598 domain-containing protein n=1 Tax=Stieleria tagensis TaxID=2956795 RepID=UPI00209AB935|nr:DUF1598 domain-containing protein [Stieleria tagensis]MCO8121940.1 DUF1598 domain-containing protein [Stieleria tagensis]